MRVVRHADPAAFLRIAEPALADREAYHNLPLSLARTCAVEPKRYAGPNYFATIEDDRRLVGVAVRTTPHRLVIYVPPGAAVDAVVEDVAGTGPLPGVHGPAESAAAFAAAWCARQGISARVATNSRAFELRRVGSAPPTSGAMRIATESDVPIAGSWWTTFERETHAIGGMPAEELARRAVRQERLFFWDDGGPVAQAAFMGSTVNGARIGAVFTPAERRRRGYATALVAALSSRLLAEGRRFCFLFTDLANPVSNSIYPKVGYRPIGDFRDIDFVSA